jgi:hypothetical protein
LFSYESEYFLVFLGCILLDGMLCKKYENVVIIISHITVSFHT